MVRINLLAPSVRSADPGAVIHWPLRQLTRRLEPSHHETGPQGSRGVRLSSRQLMVVVLVFSVLLTAACSGEGGLDSGGRDECSPSHVVKDEELGEIVVQQAGKNKAISWGFKAKKKYRGARYKLKVYLGGRKVDDKNQEYAPHGSQNAARAKKYSGKIFEIVGTAKKDGDTINYEVRCYIA